VLLETLVCLAVLGIIFPLTQKYIMFSYQKFHKARLKLQAVQIARAELSRLEARLELENDAEEYEGAYTRLETGFVIQSKIRAAERMLREMTVQVEWQYREKPETYALRELYIPAQKAEKNDISS
jgi:hypothetical protein